MPPQNNQPLPTDRATTVSVPDAATMQLPRRGGAGKVVLVIFLIILFAALAAGGTWYYMNRRLNSEKQQQQAQIDTLNTQVASLQADLDKAKNSVLSGVDQKAIDNLITKFYDGWLKSGTVAAKTTTAQNDGLISAAVAKYITSASTASDPVLCTKNTPTSYEYVFNDQAAASVKATVTLKATEGNSKSSIVVTKNGNNWQITQISCPTS